jgi:hypothetical protein
MNTSALCWACALLLLLGTSTATESEHDAPAEHGKLLAAWFENAKLEAHRELGDRLAQQASAEEDDDGTHGRRLSAKAFDPASVLGRFNCVANSKSSVDLTGVITAFTPEILTLVKAMKGAYQCEGGAGWFCQLGLCFQHYFMTSSTTRTHPCAHGAVGMEREGVVHASQHTSRRQHAAHSRQGGDFGDG